jgi:polyhydroxybutyrate depolymerase
MWLRLIPVVAVAALAAAGCSTNGAPHASAPPASTSTTLSPGSGYAPGRHTLTFDVDGVSRTAVVAIPPASAQPAPLVFVFHGHGGSGANIDRRFGIETLWPSAVVVYPNGLVGHKGVTDPNGVKSGWQTRQGEAGDRDIAFFDAMLSTLRSRLTIDGQRIYLMGHSNGSAFVSLLLNQRGDQIAATANLSAQPPARLLAGDPVRSMFMAMGTHDPVVPYANQARSIPLVQQKLGVDTAHPSVHGDLRSYRAPGGVELETYVYDGGHEPPAEVPKLVVEFFQRHTLPSS